MTFEIIKGLLTIIALIQGLTGGAAEFADQPGIGGMTLGAFNIFGQTGVVGPGLRRSYAILLQFYFSGFTHPVGGPGRG